MNKWIAILGISLLAGCSTLPENLQLADESNLVTYPQVASSPEANADKDARWGGVIANIENQADATMVEMVHFPLRSYGRPSTSNESIGRFRVYVDGFLDPVVFTQGRSMTFTGQVVGVEEGVVGEREYAFPTLRASAYHLWREVQTVDVHNINLWPYYHWHRWPYYHHYPYHRQRLIIRKNHYHGGNKVDTKAVKRQSTSSAVTNVAQRGSVDRNVKDR